MPRQPTVTEIRLKNIAACLTLAIPLLNELNDAFGPPFIPSISMTIQALIKSVEEIKRNKRECASLMDNIHQVLCAIISSHMKSETVGALPPSMLHEIGKFTETLHKIYTFLQAQKEGNKIKQLFRNNEMNGLLRDCQAGLDHATEVFGIYTRSEILNDIGDFKQTANLMHKELLELIETFSDANTLSERSSVYLGANESKNSSNSFSMLPSKPKIFHGRDQELTHIMKLLVQQLPRIAILGGGGMGKTSLARAALHHSDISARYEYRFFVSAEAATTSTELAELIGLHVGLNLALDLTKAVVRYFLEKSSCLLILDNLETVWEPLHSRVGVEEFLSLLSQVENLALMITMRGAERPAKVQWTHPFLMPLQPLSDDAARQTFLDITDNSDPMEEIDKVLQFTSNMPLAVDLIAHLADYEGLSNIFSRWETEKTCLLSIGADRRSNLDVSIRLSLSSPRINFHSRELLSLLSILPNGLSDAELVQINVGIMNILSCRAALQATSLVYRDSNQRILLLTPVREYIQRVLPPPQSLIQKYHGEQLPPVVMQITLNLANVQEVLQRGLYLGAPSLADMIYCVLSLNRFYRVTGRDHTVLMDSIQPVFPCPPDHQLETEFLTEVLKTGYYKKAVSEAVMAQAITKFNHITDILLESRFYEAAGIYFLYQRSDSSQATQYFKKALELSELCEDSNQQCSVLIDIGWLNCWSGDYTAGRNNASTAKRLSKLSANFYQEANANQVGAACSRYLGKYKESAAQLLRARELVALCGLSGGDLDHDIALGLAEIYLVKSEYAEARSIFNGVVEATSTEHNSPSYANALLNMALVDMSIGQAKNSISQSLVTVREIFDKTSPMDVVMCDMVQAVGELKERRFHIAKIKFQKCLQSTWGIHDEGACFCLEQLANINAWPTSGSPCKWPIVYLAYAYKSQLKLALHKALLFIGDTFNTNQDEITAANLYGVALVGFTSMDIHQSRAECMLRLGDLATSQGHTSEAITLWIAARPLFERSLQAAEVAQIDGRIMTVKKELGCNQQLSTDSSLLKGETFESEV
ncbi:hypothetical protein K438DRAFT_1773095 [Mycena galopus ATCC 62051]|nr:hypothetical protein K438DRAFT_1773095 [Mycena galopus ATCC 62051]